MNKDVTKGVISMALALILQNLLNLLIVVAAATLSVVNSLMLNFNM